MPDLNKVCRDCNSQFTVTEDNQKWFAERNLHIPERCPECRKKRRAAKNNGGK